MEILEKKIINIRKRSLLRIREEKIDEFIFYIKLVNIESKLIIVDDYYQLLLIYNNIILASSISKISNEGYFTVYENLYGLIGMNKEIVHIYNKSEKEELTSLFAEYDNMEKKIIDIKWKNFVKNNNISYNIKIVKILNYNVYEEKIELSLKFKDKFEKYYSDSYPRFFLHNNKDLFREAVFQIFKEFLSYIEKNNIIYK